MLNMEFLIVASIQATKNKLEVGEKIKSLPGKWDIINPDGTLTTVNNKSNDEEICKKHFTKLAYIKTVKDSERDNRTYLQVDSMETYIKYHILKKPSIYISDANNFSNMEMGFDIQNIVEELGVPKKNILYRITI
jgi:hypothetical protein|tara:strand:+ start:636 stop:1040 length:405 start_codon:yes stop_codon:yes gene_type:complete